MACYSLRTLSISAAIAACFAVSPVYAQTSVEPDNGGMVRLDPARFWKTSPAQVQLSPKDTVRLPQDYGTPSISPDGTRVILSVRADAPGKSGRLLQWNKATRETETVLEDENVSPFVTWTGKDQFFMREKSAPFFEKGTKYNFDIAGKRAAFRSRRPIQENAVVAYDADDIIVMQRLSKVQAISDVTVDRYFGPQVSPKEDFVVFSGLTTGVNLFDITTNSVVFQDKTGSDPRFSTDGRYLVYARTTDDGHAFTSGDIMILDLARHTLTAVANPSGEIRIHASLSDGAGFLAWQTADGKTFHAKLSAFGGVDLH